MAVLGKDLLSLFQIVFQGGFHFIAEVDDGLIAAFPMHADALFLEIDIFKIKADTFRNADPGAEKESEESDVAQAGLIIETLLVFGELRACVSFVQHIVHLICIQTDDRFLMKLRKRDKSRYIPG